MFTEQQNKAKINTTVPVNPLSIFSGLYSSTLIKQYLCPDMLVGPTSCFGRVFKGMDQNGTDEKL